MHSLRVREFHFDYFRQSWSPYLMAPEASCKSLLRSDLAATLDARKNPPDALCCRVFLARIRISPAEGSRQDATQMNSVFAANAWKNRGLRLVRPTDRGLTGQANTPFLHEPRFPARTTFLGSHFLSGLDSGRESSELPQNKAVSLLCRPADTKNAVQTGWLSRCRIHVQTIKVEVYP